MNQLAYGLVFLSVVWMVGCGDGNSNASQTIGPENFRIEMDNQHPFLIDHSRVCVVTWDGHEIERIKLYPDTGTGFAFVNLYRSDTGGIVLIDTNGTWYRFDPTNGKLVGSEWRHGEQTPRDYLGRIAYDRQSNQYKFVTSAQSAEQNPYLVKDPWDR